MKQPLTRIYNSLVYAVRSLLLVALSLSSLFSQATIVSAGYAPPTLTVAPGQVVTIYALGLSVPAPVSAPSLPLPYSLGGISVSFTQAALPTGSVAVPLFSVATDPVRRELTDITVQIPSEAVATGSAESPSYATVTVSQNGSTSASVTALVAVTNLRIIPYCSVEGFCSPGFWHASGEPVTAADPAMPGENLTAYLTGLGAVFPVTPSGAAPTSPTSAANQLTNINVNLTYTVNPLPDLGVGLTLSPTYAGVTPGFVGLYQVNFQIPAVAPAGTPSCSNTNPSANVNITISAPETQFVTSSDGGLLCVSF